MTNGLPVTTNDGVHLDQGVVEGVAEVEPLVVKRLQLLRHEIPGGLDRRPRVLPPLDRQVVTVPLNAVAPHHPNHHQCEDSYKHEDLT